MDSPPQDPTLRQRSKVAVVQSTKDPTTSTTAVPDQSADASSILSSFVQGASYLVLLQLISRMLTFTLNQALLRFTTAETLGIASVRLELLLNTILFLSREGVRCAVIRVSDDNFDSNTKDSTTTTIAGNIIQSGAGPYQLQKLVNMAYAPIPVGALMTCLAVGSYLSKLDDSSVSELPGYRLSIYLYGLSALIELVAEPMFMVAQYKLWLKTRVIIEGTAVIVRCVLTCALTIYGAQSSLLHAHTDQMDMTAKNTMGVLAFAIAQFAYALFTLGGFLLAFRGKSLGICGRDLTHDVISLQVLLPRKLVRSSKDGKPETFYFDTALLKLSKILTAQSLLKHLLTEGDKMLMSGFITVHDQGIYAFVNNYGSLVARILFQPMEETSRMYFGRLLSDVGSATTNTKDPKIDQPAGSSTTNATQLSETQVRKLILSRDILLIIIKFHIFLGLIFIAFGSHYTATLIDLVVGQYWSRQTEAPAALSLYCYYIPILGLNGITEAVVQAVASKAELEVLSYWMIGFSAVFCTTSAILMGAMGLGVKGIVLANCVNLSMRILWSIWFLSGFYGRYIPENVCKSSAATTTTVPYSKDLGSTVKIFGAVPWKIILPSPMVLVAFGAAFVVTTLSERRIGWDRLSDKALHMGIGVSALAAVILIIYMFEKQFIRDLQRLVRQRRE